METDVLKEALSNQLSPLYMELEQQLDRCCLGNGGCEHCLSAGKCYSEWVKILNQTNNGKNMSIVDFKRFSAIFDKISGKKPLMTSPREQIPKKVDKSCEYSPKNPAAKNEDQYKPERYPATSKK